MTVNPVLVAMEAVASTVFLTNSLRTITTDYSTAITTDYSTAFCRWVLFKSQKTAALCAQTIIHGEDNREFTVYAAPGNLLSPLLSACGEDHAQ